MCGGVETSPSHTERAALLIEFPVFEGGMPFKTREQPTEEVFFFKCDEVPLLPEGSILRHEWSRPFL